MVSLFPAVEAAHDEDLFGVGGPDGEVRSCSAVDRADVGSKPLVQLDVASFVKEVEIVIAEQRHWSAPRRLRPFFGSARGLAVRDVASSAARCPSPEHSEGESPPRDPPGSRARCWPYCRIEIV